MTTYFRIWSLLLCSSIWLDSSADAIAQDFSEVATVKPSQMIKHEVDIKGVFDDEMVKTVLAGPKFFSHGVGRDNRDVPEPNSYLNWYEIERPKKEPRRTLSVRDPLKSNAPCQITIEESAFLLSPAQRLTTGSPSPTPDGLNYFKAYRVIDAPPINVELTLAGTFGPAERTVVKAVFLCIPSEERHHDEHFSIKDPSVWLLVYELVPHPQSLNVNLSTIDQFGLNRLHSKACNWMCLQTNVGIEMSSDAAETGLD